ncbi:MAG: hypothetical protein ABEH64_09415 [Salinirussus sp.]
MTEVTLLTGIVWGLVGAVAMVIVMQVLGEGDPPPFAVFWSKFIGGQTKDAMPQSLLLHAVYAAIAGALYVVIFSAFDLGFAITGFTGGIIWGIVWAIILLVIGMMFWGNLVLDMDPSPAQMRTMGVAHLAYGLVLGILSAAVPHLL